ncbi:MAG: hypothetical protein LBT59_00160 [Clostridiales bacterium]|jgi:hypothetical protein|nr:hypothetical protein [Clostridiales bacterium]
MITAMPASIVSEAISVIFDFMLFSLPIIFIFSLSDRVSLAMTLLCPIFRAYINSGCEYNALPPRHFLAICLKPFFRQALRTLHERNAAIWAFAFLANTCFKACMQGLPFRSNVWPKNQKTKNKKQKNQKTKKDKKSGCFQPLFLSF